MWYSRPLCNRTDAGRSFSPARHSGCGCLQTGAAAGAAPTFVRTASSPLPGGAPEFDVVVSGGTLGIFLAAALQLRGIRVAVLERGPLRGRQQEWNISRKELYELVRSRSCIVGFRLCPRFYHDTVACADAIQYVSRVQQL